VVRYPVKLSTFKVLWPASFLLIVCLLLALFISTGTAPQGTAPQGTAPQATAPQATPRHHAATDPASASDKFSYLGTDIQGIRSYSVISAEMGTVRRFSGY
jgi:hypothetical protein